MSSPLPVSLVKKLNERASLDSLRRLRMSALPIDFCSNDYLGIARSNVLRHDSDLSYGSTGSRLLAGNYPLAEKVEQELAIFHDAPAALLFNSGYDANIGLLSCVPLKGDTILYDALIHASLRDGIRLSFAQSFSFRHNDLKELERRLYTATGNVYVVTETVFSMDGDTSPLQEIVALCQRFNAHLIVDEAHATGVIGAQGEGLAQHLKLHHLCFARVHTFGKAVGCHGAAVLGSNELKDYLINFCRSFIYTTALPPTATGIIQNAYSTFPTMQAERAHLGKLVQLFRSAELPFPIGTSDTPIQIIMISGNKRVKAAAAHLQAKGLDVRPILYPTVPEGTERLRIVLHAFNTEEEVRALIDRLQDVLA